MTATNNAREGDGVADLSERRALRKALDALDALSEAWAEEANIAGMCANIAKAPNLPEAIFALALQAWVEGAYAGRTSHQDHPAMQAPKFPQDRCLHGIWAADHCDQCAAIGPFKIPARYERHPVLRQHAAQSVAKSGSGAILVSAAAVDDLFADLDAFAAIAAMQAQQGAAPKEAGDAELTDLLGVMENWGLVIGNKASGGVWTMSEAVALIRARLANPPVDQRQEGAISLVVARQLIHDAYQSGVAGTGYTPQVEALYDAASPPEAAAVGLVIAAVLWEETKLPQATVDDVTDKILARLAALANIPAVKP